MSLFDDLLKPTVVSGVPQAPAALPRAPATVFPIPPRPPAPPDYRGSLPEDLRKEIAMARPAMSVVDEIPILDWLSCKSTKSPVENMVLLELLKRSSQASKGSFSWDLDERNNRQLIIVGDIWKVIPQFCILNGRYRLDFAFFVADKKIAFEIDGYEYHSSKEALLRDRKRDRDAQDDGWLVRRYTGVEVYNNVSEVVDDVLKFVSR